MTHVGSGDLYSIVPQHVLERCGTNDVRFALKINGFQIPGNDQRRDDYLLLKMNRRAIQRRNGCALRITFFAGNPRVCNFFKTSSNGSVLLFDTKNTLLPRSWSSFNAGNAPLIGVWQLHTTPKTNSIRLQLDAALFDIDFESHRRSRIKSCRTN